ncbi:CYFA0S05e05380g1_1 [Cyberlindnera fabianii]|uniref:CYFA0S05e05380g1_1 n=1 Tax=Cyberlindnera fabianii TaxID=36022 RepID=A0A061ATF7_CYBFA|nr:VIP36-like protein [Cyberlindnera fabianii]CDR40872.1 CYFA0S05e05380g1_1 [Cyberlindnera fabianii]
MSLVARFQRDRRFQVGGLITGLILLYLLLFRSSSSKSSFSYEEINDILSGKQAGSDIEQIELPHLSLHTPFFDEGLKSNDWELNGDVLVKNNEYVRLTMERKDQAGLIFSKNSFDDVGFEVDFRFSLHGSAKTNGLKGDGMAMFLTDKKLGLGTVFGAEDKFNGLGLFFDTYRNARKGRVFPYITVMNGDGNTEYDKDHDGKANELGGCTARGIFNTKQGYVDARLIHTVEDGYLSLDYNVNGNWVNCFSIKDVHIPEKRYLGFSAATGDLFENAHLLDVKTSKLEHHGEPVPSFQTFVNDEKREEKEEAAEKVMDKKRRSSYPKQKMRNEKQRAKLRAKLRNKQRNLERRMMNNAENEGIQFFSTLWWLFKKCVIAVVVLFIAYVGFTVYRVKKRSWKQKRHTGLLD